MSVCTLLSFRDHRPEQSSKEEERVTVDQRRAGHGCLIHYRLQSEGTHLRGAHGWMQGSDAENEREGRLVDCRGTAGDTVERKGTVEEGYGRIEGG